MWNTGTYYKGESVRNYANPTYNIKLYNDNINYIASNGTAFGTKLNAFVYNDLQEKIYFETGTATLNTIIVSGGTLISQYGGVAGYRHGSWLSPIITPFYNAYWDTLTIRDTITDDHYDASWLYTERFESWEHLMEEKYWFTNTTGFNSPHLGTIIGPTNMIGGSTGIYGNSLYMNIAIGTGEFYFNRSTFDLPKTFYDNQGEIRMSFKPTSFLLDSAGTFTGTLKISSFLFSDNETIDILWIKGTTSTGSIVCSYTDASLTFDGIGLGTVYNINFSWKDTITNKEVYSAWVNGTYKVGTHNGTHGGGTSTLVKWMTGREYTGTINNVYFEYLLDGVTLWGSAIHTGTWTGNRARTEQFADYYIRTGTDGTNFTAWYNITGTKIFQDSGKLTSFKIGTMAPYAQFMIVLGTYANAGTNVMAEPYKVVQFQPNCYYKVPENDIVYISPIDTRLESQNKIGLIEAGGFDVKLSNAFSKFKGKETLYNQKQSNDWTVNSLFFNRPVYVNQPIALEAGFQCSRGTELIPAAYGFIQKFSVSPDNMYINITAIDYWGLIGDRVAGTRSATGTVTDYIKEIMLYNGVPEQNIYIESAKTTYGDIPTLNTKPLPYIQNNGGFGDVWNTQGIQINGDRYPFITSQTTDANYYAGVTWRWDKQEYRVGIYDKTFTIKGADAKSNFDVPVFNYSITDNMPVAILNYKELSGNTSNIIQLYTKHKSTGSTMLLQGYSVSTDGKTIIPGDIRAVSFTDGVNCMLYNAKEGNNGTGYYCLTSNGTAYLKRFNAFAQDLNTAATLGTYTPISMCMVPQPLSLSQGTTNKWFYLINGKVGTQNYIYKYLGTSPYTFVEATPINQTIWGGMGYDKTDNIIRLLGAHKTTGEGFKTIDTIGIFGGYTQHYPILNATMYVNGTASINTAGTVYLDNTRGVYAYNNMFTTGDIFTCTYTINGLQVGGFLGSTTVKQAVQDLSNAALYYSFFDAAGNFHFTNRIIANKVLNIQMDGERFNGTYLNELPISADYNVDVNRIKTKVSIQGTSTYTAIFQDGPASAIYGTRELGKYTNTWIPTQADTNAYGTILLDYLKNARYQVSIKIPGHPEITPGIDCFALYDSFNNKVIDNIIIKQHKFDPMNWTSEISGESYKRETI